MTTPRLLDELKKNNPELKEASVGFPKFLTLPQDLQINIFSYSSYHELARVSEVSKKYNREIAPFLPWDRLLELSFPNTFAYAQTKTEDNQILKKICRYVFKSMFTDLCDKNGKDVVALETYIEEGDLDRVLRFKDQSKCLAAAIKLNKPNIVEAVLKQAKQQNVLVKLVADVFPLHLACSVGHEGIVKILLSFGEIDVNKIKDETLSPLICATMFGHLNTVKLLLEEAKADVNLQVKEDFTALHSAALKGHIKIIEFLLSHQADINQRTTFGLVPLRAAVMEGKIDAFKVLLRAGADVTLFSSKELTPEYLQGRTGMTPEIQELILEALRIQQQNRNANRP